MAGPTATPASGDLVGKHRPPLARMMRIHQAILAGDFPNATRLAVDLEVSTKTIHRDIDFMRDRLELPIEYHDQKFGYHYTEEVRSFPTLQITEGELVALLVAEKALQQYRGTNFEKPLVSAFKKMAASLPETVSLHLSDWDQTISFRTRAEQVLDLNTFDALARAASRRERLVILYRKPGRPKAEERTIDPWHLANINGEWFLFAWDHLRKDLRTFVPSRIQSVRGTCETFARPDKFSLDERLRGSFGVHSGQGEYRVVIRFDATTADYVREKKWHPSQTTKDLKDGGLELRLTLTSLGEIQRWILGWGGHAVVVSPKELARSVHEAAQNILQKQP